MPSTGNSTRAMTEPRTIRLLISYDGSDFSGWQRQGSDRSVQGDIETALEKLHKHPVSLHGSGRTDTGVHAVGQVAHFHCDIESMEAARFVPALNALLPQDVRILDAREAPSGFHARFDARSRLYRYFIIANRPATAHELRYAWQLWHDVDIGRLNELASCLKGEMDCSLFTCARDQSQSRMRYLYHSRFVQEGRQLVYEIEANAFLLRMVRSVVGTLIHAERNGETRESFAARIASCDRKLAGPTAPAKGLFLWHISYYREGGSPWHA